MFWLQWYLLYLLIESKKTLRQKNSKKKKNLFKILAPQEKGGLVLKFGTCWHYEFHVLSKQKPEHRNAILKTAFSRASTFSKCNGENIFSWQYSVSEFQIQSICQLVTGWVKKKQLTSLIIRSTTIKLASWSQMKKMC